MKKKGYTLIEVLATIIILGLIIAVGYGAINKYVHQSRKNIFAEHLESLKQAAENMANNHLANNLYDCSGGNTGKVCPLPQAGEISVITLQNLIDSGFIEPLANPVDGGKTFCNPQLTKVVVFNESKVRGVTDIKHKICLVCGGKEYGDGCNYTPVGSCGDKLDCPSVECGDILVSNTRWTNRDVLASVVCKKAQGGNQCSSPVFTKLFKSKDVEMKTGQIRIYDLFGNPKNPEKNCNVNVYLDTKSPTVELNVGTGIWGNDNSLAEITKLVDNGSGVSSYGMGTSKIPDYNLIKTKKISELITPSIGTIYAYAKDFAGNEGYVAKEVRFDYVNPVIKGIYYGYQVYPQKNEISSISGTTINLNNKIQRFKALNSVIVRLNGNVGGSFTVSSGGTTLGARTFTVGAKEIKLNLENKILGSLSINFNSNATLQSVTKIVLFSKENGISGVYTNKDVELYVDAIDDNSGIKEYLFNDVAQKSPYKIYSTNKTGIKVEVKDLAGNIASKKDIVINNIDKNAPICNTNPSNQDTEEGVNVTYNVSDDIGLEQQYNWSLKAKTGNYAVTNLKNNHSIEVFDLAGNSKKCGITVKAVNQIYEEKVAAIPQKGWVPIVVGGCCP